MDDLAAWKRFPDSEISMGVGLAPSICPQDSMGPMVFFDSRFQVVFLGKQKIIFPRITNYGFILLNDGRLISLGFEIRSGSIRDL